MARHDITRTRYAEPAGDYVPYVPGRYELPKESADRLLAFAEQFPDDGHTQVPEPANEMSRLPADLRWTGFPPELRV
jgi:hypothetical protein